jgi:hypothetical protein
MQSKIITTALFFIFIFLFGFWLSRFGKPYNGLIFNSHKLIGLAMGIFLIVTVYQVHKISSFSPVETLSIGVTVLIFIILVAAGGLLSIQAASDLENTSKSMVNVITAIHRVLPYLAVLSTAGTLYLLLFYKA